MVRAVEPYRKLVHLPRHSKSIKSKEDFEQRVEFAGKYHFLRSALLRPPLTSQL